jgi:NADH-quinone oxidoreductase subunit K
MLAGVSLLVVLFSKTAGLIDAQLMVFFIMIISACEVAIGISLVLALFRKKQSIFTEDIKIITE